jgi:hypothetical protein
MPPPVRRRYTPGTEDDRHQRRRRCSLPPPLGSPIQQHLPVLVLVQGSHCRQQACHFSSASSRQRRSRCPWLRCRRPQPRRRLQRRCQ